MNLYAYVGGNPVSFIDPTGLDLTQYFTTPEAAKRREREAREAWDSWLGEKSPSNDLCNDPCDVANGYPYYPSWPDALSAVVDAGSATHRGFNSGVYLTSSGPAPARYTLQAALVIAGSPVIAATGLMDVTAATVIANPCAASDFVQGALDPGPPPPTIPGALGAATNVAITTTVKFFQ